MIKDKIKELMIKDSLVYSKPDNLFLFLAEVLGVPSDRIRSEIKKMISSGEIFEIRKGKFLVLPSRGYVKGKFSGSSKGYGFCDVGDENDIFIPGNRTLGAIDGDGVIVKLFSLNGGKEGEVVDIFSPVKKLVGRVVKINKNMFLEPDNEKIAFKIPLIKSKKFFKQNEKVVVNVIRKKNGKLSGEVVETLGDADDVKTLELAIIRQHNLYESFSDEAEKLAQNLNKPVSKQQKAGRLDLTKIVTFTIDGEDAKDFDDAVSISALPKGGYELGVHIADVGEYVKQGSLIDKEAFDRGTSTYFPTSVLPMLPTPLSNGICSLNEGEERLTLSCIIKLDKNANIFDYQIKESVIKSSARLTYTEVYPILIGKDSTPKANKFKKELILMGELARILQNNREKRGALDLDIPEAEFVFDESGYVVDVKKRERNDAHKLIEEFMILANEVVAKHFNLKNIPFVYRVHEKPTVEKVKSVLDFLKGLGLAVPKLPQTINPDYIKKLIELVSEKDYSETANKIILRSMQKAVYKNQNLGHFGLALEYYCHFTSPIRRYPDLTIHRIIKEYLHNDEKIDEERKEELEDFTYESSLQSSEAEKNSDKAEREIDDLWRAYLMKDRVGEIFDGVISSVTNFGMFVGLENSVEGLIKLEDLPGGGYLYFEKSLELKNQSNRFKIGDKVKVKLINANVYTRKIDFELVK